MNDIENLTTTWAVNGLPTTLAHRTRRVYDRLSAVYPLSTMFFHSRAHRQVLAASQIRDGMKVLEIATGSGEMFRRIVKVNPSGANIGVDLSPKMAARTQHHARKKHPGTTVHCQAVDARHMPFPDAAFDAVVCCYLLELLSSEDIVRTISEIRRVLRPRGSFGLVLIGQHTRMFNQLYRVLGKVAPAFWGRQVEQRVPELINSGEFTIVSDVVVKQSFYPSRVLVARK